MELIVDRCAGLDVGKDEVVACVRTPSPSGRGRTSELRTFPTFTSGLEELADWLSANGVVEVVMSHWPILETDLVSIGGPPVRLEVG